MYPPPKLVAHRLHQIWKELTIGLDHKSIHISKEQFNALSGRTQIERSFLTRVDNQLKKEKISVFRIGTEFGVADSAALKQWPTPRQATIDRAIQPVKITSKKILTVRTKASKSAKLGLTQVEFS